MNKILHIEDEVDIQEVARIALEDVGGFFVTVVGSGKEGLAAASRTQPDVILLDVMMPGMDGPTTLQELRRTPATASIPVIFMTAKAQTHEIERYLALGALGVITKPFDPMTLAEEVSALLKTNQKPRG
jgi:two-component system, OmpR family, response regulator